MSEVISIIAGILEAIANSGAGSVSNGVAFDPELPKELRK